MSSESPVHVSVSAPGKVILHGEHSVVYGKTGVVVSIDLQTTVTLKRDSTNTRNIITRLPDLGVTLSFSLESLKLFLRMNSGEFNKVTPGQSFCENSFIELKEKIVDHVENNNPDILNSVNTENPKAISAIVAFLFLYMAMSYDKGFDLEPLCVEVKSEIPVGAGLGSSAAFSVAMAGAFYHFLHRSASLSNDTSESSSSSLSSSPNHRLETEFSIKPNHSSENASVQEEKKNICDWAFLAEKILHGKPSGLDNSICAYGGLLTFKKGKIDSIRIHPAELYPLRIILINSQVARNTQSLVEKVKTDRANLLPGITDCILDAMDQVAKKCLKILDQLSEFRCGDFENGNISGGILNSPYVENCYHVLEQLIDTNQGLLASIGVSHPRLEEIRIITGEHGFHSKLTGAGGGGFAFALITPSHTKQKIETVTRALKSKGFDCWETKIATEGVNLISQY